MATMMSVKIRWISMLALALVPVTSVQAADVAGAWRAQFDTQIGVQKYTYTLKQDGDKDGLMRISKPFHEGLVQMDIPHIWHVDSGGHTWPVWKNDLYLIARLLFQDRKN